MDTLQECRAHIDTIDRELIRLFSERFAVVDRVAEIKKELKLAPLQPGRWQEVLDSVKSEGERQGLDPVFVGIVWNALHEFALAREGNIISGSAK